MKYIDTTGMGAYKDYKMQVKFPTETQVL